MLKWDDKIIILCYKINSHQKYNHLSESEKKLYFWLAQNRHKIHKVIIHSGEKTLMFNRYI